MYTRFSSAPQVILCSGKWPANWMNVAWRRVLIGQHFNIHTHISTQDFWGLLKDLTLLQDNAQLEEQLLPFDGAFILWFTVGLIQAFLFYTWLTSHTCYLPDLEGILLYKLPYLPEFICLCCCLVAQLCPTLCDPMDCSLPHSSVHGIFQARILGWVAIPFSRDQTYLLFGRWILYYWATWEALHMPKLGKILIKTHWHQCKSE